MPPIITVGSCSAAIKMWVHMEVVVVLPWVPETHRALGVFPHQGTPGLRPLVDGNAPGDGAGDLRVAVMDGGGADHKIAVS